MSSEVDKNDLISRREFTVESVLALLAGVTITVSGCGGTDNPSPTSPSPGGGTGNVSGTVSANHGHTAVVTSAEITTGSAVSINIQGNATHPHTVALTADDLRLIGARTQVTKTSSSEDGHNHSVAFN